MSDEENLLYGSALAKARANEYARKTLAAEKAAQHPPKLVFDYEEEWSDIIWLVETRIPAEGAGMLFGESDVGKTFVALAMSICVSTGFPWEGQAVKQGTVLFIEAEGGRSFALRKHAAKVAAGLSSKPLLSRLPFITNYEALNFGPDTTLEQARALATMIREESARRGHPPIRFVVTDTLAQNMQGNVDSNDDMGAFLKVFRAFLKALSDEPVFGLLIHHPGHKEKERGRGAYSLPADLDLIMQLDGTQDALTLSCKRMRDGERFADIPLALEKRLVTRDDGRTATTLVVVSRSVDTGATGPSLRGRILEYLAMQQHAGETTEAIRQGLGVAKASVVREVDALISEKKLRMETEKVARTKVHRYYVVVMDEPVANPEL